MHHFLTLKNLALIATITVLSDIGFSLPFFMVHFVVLAGHDGFVARLLWKTFLFHIHLTPVGKLRRIFFIFQCIMRYEEA
jgi:hypothetical protein